MVINTITTLLYHPFDCLILVHPQIQVLESISYQIQRLGYSPFNIGKELSTYLMPVSLNERSRFTQNWLGDSLAISPHSPVLCTCIDILFDPSLKIDPLALFRQAARIIRLIVLWPGEYSENYLSYAIPEHHHYRAWTLSDSLLRHSDVVIRRIFTSQGA